MASAKHVSASYTRQAMEVVQIKDEASYESTERASLEVERCGAPMELALSWRICRTDSGKLIMRMLTIDGGTAWPSSSLVFSGWL